MLEYAKVLLGVAVGRFVIADPSPLKDPELNVNAPSILTSPEKVTPKPEATLNP